MVLRGDGSKIHKNFLSHCLYAVHIRSEARTYEHHCHSQGLNRLSDYLFSSYHQNIPRTLFSGFVSIPLLWLDRRLVNGMHLLSNAVL